MMFLYDFRCINDHVVERFIDESVKEISCPFCQNVSKRVISAPVMIKKDGFNTYIETEAWAKTRYKNKKRHYDNNGDV